MFSALFAGIIMAVLGVATAVGTSVSNKKSVDATNAANTAQVESTNKTNKDIADATNRDNAAQAERAMQFNQTQSDIAYQRSTPSNQIRELIAAGYSEQAARGIVGSSGSPAAYTPASAAQSTSVAPIMSPAHLQPFMQDISSMVSSFGSLGQSLGAFADDIGRPDGGMIGYLQAEKSISIIGQHLSQIDPKHLTSVHSLQKFLYEHSHNDDFKWIKDNLSEFEKVFANPYAARALQSQLNSFTQSFTNGDLYRKGNNEVKISSIRVRREELGVALDNLDLANKSLQNYMLSIDAEYKADFTRADWLQAFDNIARLETEIELHNDPEWRMYHKLRLLDDEKTAVLILAADALDAENRSKLSRAKGEYLDDSDNSALMAVLGCCHDVGLSNNFVGSMASVALALGIDLPKTLHGFSSKIVNPLLGGFDDLVEKTARLMDWTNDKAIDYWHNFIDYVSNLSPYGETTGKVLNFGKVANRWLHDKVFQKFTKEYLLQKVSDSKQSIDNFLKGTPFEEYFIK